MTIAAEPIDLDEKIQNFISIAQDMRPALLARAAETETKRRLPDETIQDLADAGFFEYYIPRKWGGHGGTLTGQIEIASELARGCPATAWVFTLMSWVNGFMTAYLPDEGTQEILDSTNGRLMGAGANGFTGVARPVKDGYRISGTWGFCSGSAHANWAMGGVLVKDESNEVINQGWAYMPASSVTLKETWFTSGLRGTGSNTFVAEDVFVPSRLVMTMPDRLHAEANPRPTDDPVYRIPFAAMFGNALMATCLGATEAAAQIVSENTTKRGITYFEFGKQTDSGALMEQLGEAKMKIETAWLHTRRAADALDNDTINGPLDYRTRARCRADAVHSGSNLRSAMDTLLNIASASAFAESNPVQRYWRDLNVGSRHAFLNAGPVYEAFSKADIGYEPNVTIYI